MSRVRATTRTAWHPSCVRTERGFDRIVNFSDATVAIAMTLLVLPLVDIGGASQAGASVWDLLRENSSAILGFLLGFLVIWSMWVNHHRVMEYFADYDGAVLALHLVWLLTMVSLPFTTQMITNPNLYENGATALYVAVLLLSSVTLHLLGQHGRRDPELLHDRPEVKDWLAGPYTWTTPAVLAFILVLVLVVPRLGAWPMLLLFLDGFIESRIVRRRAVAKS